MLTHRYELCLERLGVKGAALVAHHEDDADENRLAELGKGAYRWSFHRIFGASQIMSLHHPETQGFGRQHQQLNDIECM